MKIVLQLNVCSCNCGRYVRYVGVAAQHGACNGGVEGGGDVRDRLVECSTSSTESSCVKNFTAGNNRQKLVSIVYASKIIKDLTWNTHIHKNATSEAHPRCPQLIHRN